VQGLALGSRGRTGPFFRLPGRGGCLGGPSTKWGGLGEARGPHGGATGSAALTFPPGRGCAGRIFFQGGSLGDERLDRASAGCPSWACRNWRGGPSASRVVNSKLYGLREVGTSEVFRMRAHMFIHGVANGTGNAPAVPGLSWLQNQLTV
jgi:hypothetical protein